MKTPNKLFAAVVLIAVGLSSWAFKPFTNGKVILVVTIEVSDFTEWKKMFDAGAPVREKAGIKVLSVCSKPGSTHQVVVIEEAENAQAAHDFLSVLKSKQKAGDMAKLEFTLYDKVD